MQQEIDKFWAFCKERESIRLKKESGALQPWTTDPILHKHKFTNINRIHDRGTKLLIKLCKYHSPYNKFCASSIYRFSGSNNKTIEMMQNNQPIYWFDLLKSVKPLFNMQAYQANWPAGKGKGIHFMISVLPKYCNSTFPKLKAHMNIKEACNTMVAPLNKFGYKAMRFQCTEIAKDLSIFTNIVNAESICPMNVGALKGLKAIFNTTSQKNLDHLINSNQNPGYNTQILEHALCEYSKYHDYQINIRKSHQKVYKPYKICYNIQ